MVRVKLIELLGGVPAERHKALKKLIKGLVAENNEVRRLLDELENPQYGITHKVWTSEWEEMTDSNGNTFSRCSKCGYVIKARNDGKDFCQHCGRAMNKKAWDMLWRRTTIQSFYYSR